MARQPTKDHQSNAAPWRRPWSAALASIDRLRRGWKLPAYPSPLLRGSVLSQMEQALVRAVADTMFPPGGLFPISGTEAGAVPYFDAYLRRCHGQEGLLLHLLLFFTELSPVVFGPRPTTFSRLSLPDRTKFLQGAFQSRIYFRRVAFTSLRALMTMAYFSHPEVAAHVGFATDRDPFGLGDSDEQEVEA